MLTLVSTEASSERVQYLDCMFTGNCSSISYSFKFGSPVRSEFDPQKGNVSIHEGKLWLCRSCIQLKDLEDL